MSENTIIAIDGFSSTGKSTIAKQLAKALNFVHIDTGAMYRAVTFYAIQSGLINDEGQLNEEQLIKKLKDIKIEFQYNAENKINETYLNNQNIENEIRGMQVANAVSVTAAIPSVREFLVEQQQEMGKKQSLVMDGRDIGTVVYPKANYKFFITADPAIRAKRRYDELKSKDKEVSLQEITENLLKRDKIDTTRAVSPLKKAEDAIEIDNSYLNQEQTLQKVLSYIK